MNKLFKNTIKLENERLNMLLNTYKEINENNRKLIQDLNCSLDLAVKRMLDTSDENNKIQKKLENAFTMQICTCDNYEDIKSKYGDFIISRLDYDEFKICHMEFPLEDNIKFTYCPHCGNLLDREVYKSV